MMNLFLAMLLGNFERASLISQVSQTEARLKILMPTTSVRKSADIQDEE